MKYSIKLPQSQQDLLDKILKNAYLEIPDHEIRFDIITLRAIFQDTDVDIKIELKKSTYDNFAIRNGVDFPEYI
jgi:hypothetical protein